VTDVTATTASAPDATAGVPEAAGVPEVAPAPAPAFDGAETSGTPESEPRVERPAEAVVSRGRTDES
jgi:hypothetical protein